ncbi:hypothetical protein K7X08_034528 [Anisodus acutangulus]|uniref:Pentatricopeptide repeat-containing protein n=1 Tax=Anisodus acutangulus TaxID=402998 RepID=A0A9Q1LIF2_9SOLA|nr:hypothetical protein K7X08_034528 [Anisodus acutangulus]
MCILSGSISNAHNVFDESSSRGVVSYNLIIDGYVKAGEIGKARKVFDEMPVRHSVSWGTILAGYAKMNQYKDAIELFDQMVTLNVRFDNIALVSALSACAQVGELEKGKTIHDYIKKKGVQIDSYLSRRLFGDMEGVYGVCRELKHYGCMADFLARAGLIKEAKEMIEAMPMAGDVFAWGGLLGGHVELAVKAAENVMEVKPEDGGVYSILANVFADARQWDDLVNIRRRRDCAKIKKNAGCSLIQLNGMTREFISWDDLHPQSD